jgi:hypothetical protein
MMMLTFDRCTSHCLYEEHKSAAVILSPITSSLEIKAEQSKEKVMYHSDIINREYLKDSRNK